MRESIDRSQLLAWVGIAAGVGLAGAPFLGWTKSGSVVRNSFETFRAAQTLGLDELTPLRVVWFVLPVIPLVVAALLVGRRRRLAGVLLAAHSLLVLGAGMVVLLSGVSGGSGAAAGATFGLLGIVLGLSLFIAGRNGPIPQGSA